ncbi:tyrosyl-DNA phosphodiesterase domain-containing protein [Apiospora phragmitis]|uniref:Tyrosyl-DNA phosphodiesterase domain-containing protein n=1 Tax=Apiospora phragmitis TaxID=2905665 RepID=A0ABR1T333_9PEZI
MDGNGGFEDDEAALRYAIALSRLQDGAGLEHGNPSTSDNPIQLSSDEEDEEDDLEKPPVYRPSHRLRRQDDTHSTKQEEMKPPSPPAVQQQTQPAQSGLAALGLDRKKMEEERLARLGKRKAPGSNQDSQDRNRRLKTASASPGKQLQYTTGLPGLVEEGAFRAPPTGVPLSTSQDCPSKPMAMPTPTPMPPTSGLRWPKGVVKKTWAAGFPTTGDEVRIDEVLQKDQLQLAIISSLTKLMCIAYASSEQQRKEIEANAPNENVRFCFPPMLPMGSMHSKLQLLRFPNHLRIVVPSGNFVPYDWGETGAMENVIFIIDLPKVQTPGAAAANKLTMFGEELCYFLTAQGLDKGLVTSLAKYDFAETNRYAFIHTIGGTHVDDSWKRTGYCGLGRAVSALGLNTPSLIDIDLVISSLGSVNHELLCAVYYAAQGDDGQKVLRERTSKTKARMAKHELSSATLGDHFRIYFPSHDTVAKSRGGPRSAGTICAQSKWWDSDTFPRDLIHDYKNVRNGLLLHTKMMLVRGQKPNGGPVAWGYVGSANLSESACCRNWECGVVIPAAEQGVGSAPANKTSPSDMSVFLGSIPVPIVASGNDNYGRTRSKRPWLFLGD